MADTTLPGVLRKGVAGSRPAANAVGGGTLYSATDTGAVTQSDGVSTWSTWATIGSGDLAGKELDYVARTTNASITATSEATADTVITGSSVAYDGSTIVMVEFWANHAGPDVSGLSDLRFWLYDGSSSIGFFGYVQQTGDGANVQYVTVHSMRRITPTAASHTYSVRASVDAGTGTVAAGAGGSGNVAPAFLRITRVSS